MNSTIRGNRFGLFFVLYFLVGNFAIAFISKAFPVLREVLPSIATTQLLLVFVPSIIYILYLIQKGESIIGAFRLYKTSPINIVLSILLAITAIPLVMFINVLSQFIVEAALNDTLSEIGSQNYGLALLTIAVFPGIFEELISRGIIQSNYRYKRVFTTSLISGFFFGMMHMNFNQFLYAFVLGILFSLVVHVTGSIVCSMLMHFVINGVNLSLAFLASSDLFKSLPGYEDPQLAMANIDQTQLLIQSLIAIGIVLIISLPFLALVFTGLILVNDKKNLLFKNARSYEFFPKEVIDIQNELSDEPILLEDELAPKFTQPVLTLSLALTTITFIAVALISEL